MPPLERPPRKKDQRKAALAQRALQMLEQWMGQVTIGAPA